MVLIYASHYHLSLFLQGVHPFSHLLCFQVPPIHYFKPMSSLMGLEATQLLQTIFVSFLIHCLFLKLPQFQSQELRLPLRAPTNSQ